MERVNLSPFPLLFLILSPFLLHFLILSPFSRSPAARLPGCNKLCNPDRLYKRMSKKNNEKQENDPAVKTSNLPKAESAAQKRFAP